MSTKIKLSLAVLALLIGATIVICIKFYPYVFSKEVTGEVVGIERVLQATTIVNAGAASQANSQVFSFAVAIKGARGEIFTASTEDRQWAVVQKGQCAEAKFLPYPFWEFDKAGTFFGARLIRLYECPPKGN